VVIDRVAAARLGISVEAIADALYNRTWRRSPSLRRKVHWCDHVPWAACAVSASKMVGIRPSASIWGCR